MNIQGAFNKPFDEAIAFFENKLKLPTASYTDIWREQHSHAFVVAGAMNDALVEDFYNALHQAMTQGTGLVAFQKSFDEIVAKHGWSHHGSAEWRSKLIYDTNIRQAYNVGKYQQMMEVAHLRPIWTYKHISIINPRIAHVHLDGFTRPADDPVWDYIMPQNGYGCQCQVDSYTMTEWDKTGCELSASPTIEWESVRVGTRGSNPREVLRPIIKTAKGDAPIDPGFAYNPAKAFLKPFTVPPLTGYDAVLAERDATWVSTLEGSPPMPMPTVVKPGVLLPASTDPILAVQDFLSVFGADLDTGVVFEDVTGTPIAVTKDLFTDGKGEFKWLAKEQKANRLSSINLLAMTLAQPDEVWYNWERDRAESGNWRLKRRYLKIFKIEGAENQYGISAFEWNRSKGWTGATTFMSSQQLESDRESYFDRQRVGKLVYKKP